MSGQVIGYVRVSSADQSLERQLAAIGDVDEVFEEKISAARGTDRPQLEALLRFARKGDRVRVTSLDRLGRSLVDLVQLIDRLVDDGVEVEFVKERLIFTPNEDDPMSRLLLGVFGAIAEFERALIRERQAQGIAAAKARGVYKGRPPALTDEQLQEARAMLAQEPSPSKAAVARKLGVSRSTLWRALNRE
ncbi:MAG TPA: recombinase family protein [Baekduia sp.]|nr:recombinase family protein [Baekduia sp.]